jgi:hypothetical protein
VKPVCKFPLLERLEQGKAGDRAPGAITRARPQRAGCS